MAMLLARRGGDAAMKYLGKALLAVPVIAFMLVAAAHAGDRARYRAATARTYCKAAVHGSADAQARLGALLTTGEGVARSKGTAFQWLSRAADQGHTRAQLMLAEAWTHGRGVPRNTSFAYKWAYLAQRNATDQDTRAKADALLAALTPQMSAAQVDEATQWAATWKPRLETSGQAQARAPGL